MLQALVPAGREAEALKLLIAIPALNEEESIGSTVRRCLEAREHIVSGGVATAVEITVVSDGSTDRTVEIARGFGDAIDLVVFEVNRGYGAAIKEAWRRSDADLLGFLDADGTCDPRFFRDLCEALERDGADIALGSRLDPSSRMPLVRRIGNRVFALLLTLAANRRVQDTASGMRVVRRACLGELMPLPDGLHFTPAMSARALVGGVVRIAELPMPYHEREGESKLKVWRDGLRFLRSIVDAAFLYAPWRPLLAIAAALVAAAAVLMVGPLAHYAQTRTVAEWMIYRFVVGRLLTAVGVLFLAAAYLSWRIVSIAIRPGTFSSPWRLARRWLSSRAWWLPPLALALAGGSLVAPGAGELLRTGHTDLHWSRFVAMAVLAEAAAACVVLKVVDYTLDLIAAERSRPRDGW